MLSGWIRRASLGVAACGLAMVLAAPGMMVPAAAIPPTTAPTLPPTPVTDHCPYRTGTPPPVDTSEVVAPGASTPSSLPVPQPPIGGDALGGCGVVADPAAGPVPAGLTSAGWLIADLDSGQIIAAKDPHGRYRPASTIKVALALVVLDELDLDAQIVPTAQDWNTEGDSCGMGPGGSYTVRDVLTGLLMASGNDCANALARELGGTEAALAAMNDLAERLGARDTRAASPSGLDAPGMSSSPYDLAILFREAMSQPVFRELIALPTFRFPGYPRRPDVPGDTDHPAYDMYTTNRLLLEDYPGMLGGKTGYTDDARKTFVGAAERDGRTIMIVQMFGLSVEGDLYWDQAKAMFEYGFRADPAVSVGQLIDAASPAASSTAPSAAPRQVTAGSDSAGSLAVPTLIGLVAALLAVLLLIGGLSLRRRR